MKHSAFEVALGALVLLAAGAFLIYGAKVAAIGADGAAYRVQADFSTVGSLKPGDAVQVSGVKVGTVESIALDPATYRARVTMALPGLPGPLPEDSSAAITSEGLMGGVVMALTPGGAEDVLPSGGAIEYTQAPQNLEQLLGKFIFTMQGDNGDAP
ncbi:MAG TPA: outer membrane lipid asymmetry maintenance protein MlaD [Rhodospirillaceae bacterium]|nr:outer membrane lipid asymmetry maintenance protein MlaD [Alphaproteobacteria bacterium]HBH27170.1 outer membrane lipid asymmetry maintenance protein MlaD [Rhodospirillaceae bacterium]